MDTSANSRTRKRLVALTALAATALASPVFAEGSHFSGGGGGGHAFSGGHMSAAPHFSGGHSVAAPHFAAAPHYAARPGAGGYGGYNAGGYAAHPVHVGQQFVNSSVHNNYAAPGRGYAAPGHAGNFAPSRAAPGRFIPGSPFRFGRWNGGWWNGGFWPRVFWGANFPWFLPAIPAFAATYWWNSIPYYYYNDVYYTYDPSSSGYVVTTPPPAQDANPGDAQAGNQPDPNASNPPPPSNYSGPGPTSNGGGLYAYPKNGQNDDQQSADRQECAQWATGQTGADSSGASVDYQRALTACLQGRGYSVD